MTNKSKEGQFEAIKFFLWIDMALTQFNYGPHDGLQGETIFKQKIDLPYSFFSSIFSHLSPIMGYD